MNIKFPRPRIVISRCLEFDACRYNGVLISDQFIKKMKNFCDFITVCPEADIGMGIPRKPVSIIDDGVHKLIQHDTDIDYTEKMNDFSNQYLNKLNNIDGFILKSKSPSCGIRSAKILHKDNSFKKMGSGIFASAVMDYFPNHPREEEKRFNNQYLREHFLTSVYILAQFRILKNNKPSFSELYKFQAKNKYLFLTYNQVQMRKLGKLAANHSNHSIDKILEEYESILFKLIRRKASFRSNLNTLEHVFGHFSKKLKQKERSFFFKIMDEYENKKIPLSSICNLIFSWAIRFNDEYILNQSYFKPFPTELIEIKNDRLNL